MLDLSSADVIQEVVHEPHRTDYINNDGWAPSEFLPMKNVYYSCFVFLSDAHTRNNGGVESGAANVPTYP